MERGYFVQPLASLAALQQLRDLASPVSAFVRDRCLISADDLVPKDDLWKVWKDWCDTEGAKAGTKAVFVRNLRAAYAGISPSRPTVDGKRVHLLHGISLALVGTPDTPDRPDTERAWSGVTVPDDSAQPSRRSGMSGVYPSVIVENGLSHLRGRVRARS